MAVVTVVYKSGAKVRLKCENFTIKRNARDGLTEVEWSKDVKPRPLFFGVDDVAAIYEGKA